MELITNIKDTTLCGDCSHSQPHEHKNSCDRQCSIFSNCKCIPYIIKFRKEKLEKIKKINE